MKSEQYKEALGQIETLIEEETDLIAGLSNIAAILHNSFKFWWTGFYLVKSENERDVLVVGPFQGPVACNRIQNGKGICGTAWKTKGTIIVDNVHEVENHIACSEESKSEIVVPLISDNVVVGVLDVDSERFSCFNEVDQQYLEQISQLITKKLWS
ncbi:MAG: diguanylate cyclase [Crocinitomicaceae bacterium]|nr:diguanylate cyclase [Crocinitomicaceae bacterium]|tara:strand:- start:827 stop:1294 length:468 start_codon:yes stop_codon:yes gene_type:complete